MTPNDPRFARDWYTRSPREDIDRDGRVHAPEPTKIPLGGGARLVTEPALDGEHVVPAPTAVHRGKHTPQVVHPKGRHLRGLCGLVEPVVDPVFPERESLALATPCPIAPRGSVAASGTPTPVRWRIHSAAAASVATSTRAAA